MGGKKGLPLTMPVFCRNAFAAVSQLCLRTPLQEAALVRELGVKGRYTSCLFLSLKNTFFFKGKKDGRLLR
jgi:hypothetical protein